MKAKSGLSLLLAVLFVLTSIFSNLVFADSTSSIKIELDKTTAAVGDTIKASIVVNNISGFAGYQVNIKYDPSFLQAVQVDTGAPYTNSTIPKGGTILNDTSYGILPAALHKIEEGILSFAKSYTNLEDYKAGGSAETTGTVAVIGFKVLKEGETSIRFEDAATMPGAVSGVTLFSWSGDRIVSGYSIIQPPVVNQTGAVATPSPIVVITATPTTSPAVQPSPSPGQPSRDPAEIGSTIVNSGSGKATYKFETSDLNTALQEAVADTNGIKNVSLTIKGVRGVSVYNQEFPKQALATDKLSYKIDMSTSFATLSVPSNMLSTGALSAKVMGASSVALSVAGADSADLPEDIKLRIGSRPIIDLSLMINGVKTDWNNPEAPVMVSIPYNATEAELKTIEHIVVLHIDKTGKVTAVPSGRYNESTGTVTFTTTHFSRYAIAYVHKTFTDLKSYAWAKKQIEVLASKGIINGTSDKTFAPKADITRADFMILLVKALDLTATVDSNFDDVAPNAYYYNHIGIAKKLGITTGVGDNKYNPKAKITRQDMMVLITKALTIANKISSEGTPDVLNKYTDKSQISSYAIPGVATLVKEGIVVGSNNIINPRGNASRAELAAIIYKIYTK